MKKKTLTVLTTVVLFWFLSFTFSSCKNCNGNKGKDGGGDNSVADGSLPALDGPTLSEEVERYLKEKGASQLEIEATMHIATEDFGEEIGHIQLRGWHYLYKDSKGYHDGQQTSNSCALYAMKRFLFVLGRHGEVSRTLWYEYTDQELRDKLAAMPGCEAFRNQGVAVDGRYLIPLMMSINVPNKYCEIWENGRKAATPGFGAATPFLTQSKVADVVKKINEDMPGFEKRAKDAQSQAQEQLKVAEEEMAKVRNKKGVASAARKTAKANVIKAAELVSQAKAQVQAAIKEAQPLMDMLATSFGLGGLALPQEQVDYASRVNKVMQKAGHEADTAAERAKALVAEADREVLN